MFINSGLRQRHATASCEGRSARSPRQSPSPGAAEVAAQNDLSNTTTSPAGRTFPRSPRDASSSSSPSPQHELVKPTAESYTCAALPTRTVPADFDEDDGSARSRCAETLASSLTTTLAGHRRAAGAPRRRADVWTSWRHRPYTRPTPSGNPVAVPPAGHARREFRTGFHSRLAVTPSTGERATRPQRTPASPSRRPVGGISASTSRQAAGKRCRICMHKEAFNPFHAARPRFYLAPSRSRRLVSPPTATRNRRHHRRARRVWKVINH